MAPRPLVLTLTLASLSMACGPSDGLECPATGAVLLPNVPELQPEWGPGCIDESTWTAEVSPANATWTVELRREASGNRMEVRRLLDGVAAVWGNELILVDSDGNELTHRALGTFPSWADFVTTEDGRMVVGAQSNGIPQYRVLDPAGVEIWLRLLDVPLPLFGTPSLTLDADGSLWVANAEFSPDFETVQLTVQQWGVTGTKQSEVILPNVESQAFARDGGGRLAVLTESGELFEPDGTPIATVDFAGGYATMLVGLDDGFVIGGRTGDKPFVHRVDGQGQTLWNRELESGALEEYDYSLVTGLAALPDGGVVTVGFEQTIRTPWPDSPITEYAQPFVLALDADGESTWGERLAVGGQAWSVAVGSEGEVYVGGSAQASLPSEYGQTESIGWLRRYDP